VRRRAWHSRQRGGGGVGEVLLETHLSDTTPHDPYIGLTVVLVTTSQVATTRAAYDCDCTSGAITLTMPAASGFTGQSWQVTKKDASTNYLTVSGASMFDTLVITAQHTSITLRSDGTVWRLA
jgi:hypothetical protein